MIVAFSGNDGSGKTTQAQKAVKLLASEGHHVRYVHMIQWTLVNRLGHLARPSPKLGLKEGQTQRRSRTLASLQQLVSVLDILRFRAFMLPFQHTQKVSLVCDRFFYDLGVQALYTGLMKRKGASRYWKLVPAPAVSVLLDVSPEIAHQREGEHDLGYYQTKRSLYLEYAAIWGSIIVDAVEMTTVQRQVTQIIHGRLGK